MGFDGGRTAAFSLGTEREPSFRLLLLGTFLPPWERSGNVLPQLVSPDDVRRAAVLLAPLGLAMRLRTFGSGVCVVEARAGEMRCDAMRCDAMRCNAMQCNAMQCNVT